MPLHFKNIRDVIKYTYRVGGFSGFYEGYLPFIMRVVPLTGVFFVFFEFCKDVAFQKLVDSQNIF